MSAAPRAALPLFPVRQLLQRPSVMAPRSAWMMTIPWGTVRHYGDGHPVAAAAPRWGIPIKCRQGDARETYGPRGRVSWGSVERGGERLWRRVSLLAVDEFSLAACGLT